MISNLATISTLLCVTIEGQQSGLSFSNKLTMLSRA